MIFVELFDVDIWSMFYIWMILHTLGWSWWQMMNDEGWLRNDEPWTVNDGWWRWRGWWWWRWRCWWWWWWWWWWNDELLDWLIEWVFVCLFVCFVLFCFVCLFARSLFGHLRFFDCGFVISISSLKRTTVFAQWFELNWRCPTLCRAWTVGSGS